MILKNGKRIDGCTDTLPIGTVQPFLGLTPPKGYLVCQGQLVSKTTYPELYAICGDLFGTATETDFYLPDLRGKTIAGYDENNEAMNSLGKLLGSSSHKHSTKDHVLTTQEMPSHTHNFIFNEGSKLESAIYSALNLGGTAYTNLPALPLGGDWGSSGSIAIDANGASKAHNHGDTGEASNYQPTVVMNWIVKAVMLIPHYFAVINSLDNDSYTDALSAFQGKMLNETKLSLSGGAMTGQLILSSEGMSTYHEAGVIIDKYGNFTHKRTNSDDVWCISNNADDKSLQYKFEAGDLAVPNQIYIGGVKASAIPRYNFSYHNTWYCLGTFNLPQNGHYGFLDIHMGVGYNAVAGQECSMTVHLRTSNGSPAGDLYYAGHVRNTSYNRDCPSVKVVQNSASSFTVWLSPVSYSGQCFFTVHQTDGASFTPVCTSGNEPSGVILEVVGVPRTYSGSGAPSSSLGKVGDIYIRTS